MTQPLRTGPARGGWLALIGWIALCQAAGVLGVLTTDTGGSPWYRALEKPAFNPPAWVFAPVWTTLYTLMGIAAYLLWRKRRHSRVARIAIAWFILQLLLNAAWTPVFFGLHSLVGGLMVIIALWIAIAATIAAAWRVSRAAPWLLLPYWVWVTFATVLNGSIAWMNGGPAA